MEHSQREGRQETWDDNYQFSKKSKNIFSLLLLIGILLIFVLFLSIVSFSRQMDSQFKQPISQTGTPKQSQTANQYQIANSSQLVPSLDKDKHQTETLKQKETAQQTATNPKQTEKKVNQQQKKSQQKKTPKPQQSSKPTAQKKLTPFNFSGAISQKKILIEKIESSMIFHQCFQFEPMFHSFDYRDYNKDNMAMYFQTYYQIFLTSCDNRENYKWSVNRQNLRKWNKDRFGIEWGFYNIQEKNNILYYRGGVYNFPEILMLSKMVGPSGTVTVLQDFQSQRCIGETLNLNGMKNNIKYVGFDKITSFQSFNSIVANESLFAKLAFKPNPSTRFLIYAGDGAKLKEKEIFKSFKIQKFVLTDGACGKGIFQQNLSGEGFYSVNSLQPKNRKLLKKQIYPSSTLGALQPKYVEFKQNHSKRLVAQLETIKNYEKESVCIDPNSNRKASSSSILTIYGHQLFGVKLEQVLKWEEERQAIEWLRSNKQKSKSVYYETKHSFNLLAIVQIAFMIGPQSTFFVVCSQSNSCGKLTTQIEKNKFKNIKMLKESSKNDALSVHVIITDNQALMKECAQTSFLEKGIILGFFDSKRNQSVLAMRKLYIKNQLRQITTPKSETECLSSGYLHFFWNYETPNSFYEIKPSKYVIYTFWGDSPKKLNDKKKFVLNQLAGLDTQVKFITPELFTHFQVEGAPFHPAYYLLTSIQKSDYFRVYMMNFYGGGYADVKHTHYNWKPYFEQLEKDETKYAFGYIEKFFHDVGCFDSEPPSCLQIKSNFQRLFGNSEYIFKKQTPLSKDWFNAVTNNLSNKYEALKNNPPRVPREANGQQYRLKDGTTFVSKYPFRWAEIANEHLARMQYKYINNIKNHMPYVIIVDYRTSNNLDQN